MKVYSQCLSVGESRLYEALAYDDQTQSVLIRHPQGEEIALRVPVKFIALRKNKFDARGISTQKIAVMDRLFRAALPNLDGFEDVERIVEMPSSRDFSRVKSAPKRED